MSLLIMLFSGIFSFFAYASDNIPPKGAILINNNAVYTNTLITSFSASDNKGGSGLSQMRFSNNNTAWSSPEKFAASKKWTLASGDGKRAVYVKFKDAAGNWSASFSDSIILDITPPSAGISINDSVFYTNSLVVTLKFSCSDSASGMGSGSQMRFSIDNVNWSIAEAYKTSKTWTLTNGDGKKTVFAKFKDVAGNWSSPVSAAIILDA